MRHFHVELERNGTVARSWDLWTERLRIGSSLDSQIVLPPPYAPVVAACESATRPLVIALGQERLRIVEDTPERHLAWAGARERMELARRMGWREPGAEKARSRQVAMALMGLLGIGAVFGIGMGVKQETRPAPPEIADIIELVKPEEKPEEPKPKDPQPQELAAVSKEKPAPEPVGGATENTTLPELRTLAERVSEVSILDKFNTQSEGMFGEPTDASAENAIDAILAGGGGHLTKGTGGRGASGNDGRMDEQAGMGFGYGGPSGVGLGVASSRQGKSPNFGKGSGNKVATRGVVSTPKPSDVELGGDAGTRSPESILRVIREHVGGFRYTYEKYLKENPSIGGKISLRFTIGPSGDIVAIELAGSSTGLAALDEEIRDKARRMRFDPIEKGNVTVTYAFVLDRQ